MSRKKLTPQQLVLSGCAVFAGVMFLMCAGIVVFVATMPPHDPSKDEPGTVWKAYEAWDVAERFILKQVKSPSTANFGGSCNGDNPGAHVIYKGNYEYHIVGWVDAENAFGAIVRSDFLVKIRDRRDGTWMLIEAPIINQR